MYLLEPRTNLIRKKKKKKVNSVKYFKRKLENDFYVIFLKKPLLIKVDKNIDKETNEIYYRAYVSNSPFVEDYGGSPKEAVDNLITSIFGDALFLIDETDKDLYPYALKKKKFLNEYVRDYYEK